MRPDEHKKKKNAAYKKKHGIGQTKGDGEESAKNKSQALKGKKNERVPTKQEPDNRLGSAQGHKKIQNLNQTDSGSSDSESEGAAAPRKTFQRRQIVSNWQKYEPLPTGEEKPEARGESFEKLLSMAGDAVAHFRFRDEQEWDMEGPSFDGSSVADQLGQCLDLDTQSVGKAMATLPIYKMLGISPEIFPESELETIHNVCAEHLESYASTHASNSVVSPLGPELRSSLQGQSSDGKSGTTSSTVEQISNSQSSSSHQKTTESISVTAHSCNTYNSNERLAIDDTDLDSLLEQDSDPVQQRLQHTETPKVNEQTNNKTIVNQGEENTTQKSSGKLSLDDDDLDSLLDTDTPSQLQPSTHNFPSSDVTVTKVSEKKEPWKQSAVAEDTNKDGVDLEDWLDSILDD